MFTVRRATPDDAAIVATLNMPVQQLHADARPDTFKPASNSAEMVQYCQALLEMPDSHIFIGEEDGQPVGYAFVRVYRRPGHPLAYGGDSVYIDQMSVNPGRQGRGYGRQLAQAVLDLARAENITRVTLSVWEFNVNAREFYAHLGFVPVIQTMELALDSPPEK